MEQLIKDVSKKLDKQLDFKKIVGGIGGFIAETFDGSIFEAALTLAYKKLPEDLHDEFEIILKGYLNDDYESIKFEAVSRINAAVDVPVLDEEDEADLFNSIFGWFTRCIERRKLREPGAESFTVGGGGGGDNPGGGPP